MNIIERKLYFLGWLIGNRIAALRGPIQKEYLYFDFDQTTLELNFMDDAAASENGQFSYVPAAVGVSGETLIVNE